MATCVNSIQTKLATNTVGSIPILYPNEYANFTLTGTSCVFYQFNLENQDTVIFNTYLFSSQFSIDSTIVFYSYNAETNTVVNLGSVQQVSVNLQFQKDLGRGTYILCLQCPITDYFTGNIILTWANFQVWANIRATFYTGGYAPATSIFIAEKPAVSCTRAVTFSLVDGILPEGLSLSSTGRIC